MKYRIHHHTEYNFSNSVFLEPHTLRFKPRQDHRQQVIFHESKVHPEPAGRNEFLDETDNLSELVWFEGKHSLLTITAISELKVSDKNPFDFLIYPFSYHEMPIQYDSTFASNRYLYISNNQIFIESYLKLLLNDFKGTTLEFLLMVTRKIHDDFEMTVRHEGAPHPPDLTFKEKKGSCRDLAVLEMEILRNAGFATRFISGYKYNQDPEDGHELHAWVEVFIPGPGWTGFDPATGLIVWNDHFPVSASYLSWNTMPLTGTFRGKAETSMNTLIRIEKITTG
ncbi:MAG: transglutaminase family protein [Cyclobacteriaceae bacterium]|nr:transglutaminase family protein [Cyclobacteriaceae bacterium]